MGHDVVSGGRVERRRPVEPVPKKMVAPKPNQRSGIQRRQKDRLAILPRAATPAERYRRQQYNQILIILLILGGAVTTLATLELILTQDALLSSLWPGPFLGLILVVAGVGLSQRPERRREDRRRP